jgi:hypothetical protein
MVSSEVQRTLVKSPPELWAELSDPETLARHLGELGEIRITRTKPEERVEWEAGSTRGTVVIKPSGWGTKVTLSVTCDIEVVAEPTEEPLPESASAEETAVEVGPTAEAPHAQDPIAVVPPADQPAAESATDVEESEPDVPSAEAEQAKPEQEQEQEQEQEPRRGFFARLFGRRRPLRPEDTEQPATEASLDESTSSEPSSETATPDTAGPEVAADTAVKPSAQVVEETKQGPSQPSAAPQAQEPAEQPEPAAEPPSEPAADLSAELAQAEEVAAEEVKAVLTAVLDRLGAAHHRPFSRS